MLDRLSPYSEVKCELILDYYNQRRSLKPKLVNVREYHIEHLVWSLFLGNPQHCHCQVISQPGTQAQVGGENSTWYALYVHVLNCRDIPRLQYIFHKTQSALFPRNALWFAYMYVCMHTADIDTDVAFTLQFSLECFDRSLLTLKLGQVSMIKSMAQAKSRDLRNANAVKMSVCNLSCSRLSVHSSHLFYASLESTRSYFDILYATKPHLTPVVSGCTLKVTDFCPPMLNFHHLTTLHTDDTGHMTYDTSPCSLLFSYNIEKTWEQRGDKARAQPYF